MDINDAKQMTPYQIEFLKLLREIREAIKSLKED